MRAILVIFIAFVTSYSSAQQSVLWENFKKNKAKSTEPILPDFSFAGYKYSEVPIPTVDYKLFDVTDFGAVANDGISDKNAIKKAIAEATKNGEGVVFFPKGKYIVNTATDDQSIIEIEHSKIVLRGEGDQKNGSIIFFEKDLPPADMAKMWTVPKAIKVSTKIKNKLVTTVITDAKRETNQIEVADASTLKKGEWVILKMQNNAKDLITYDIQPLKVDAKWTTIITEGVQVNERHQIAKVSGNKITFIEPIHYDIKARHGWEIYSFSHLNHVGFENLRFMGNYTSDFIHHGSARDDSGWSILEISKSVDSWIRDCTFENVSIPINFSASAACTALNIKIEGRTGHSSVHSGNGSTGILLAKINDTAGMHHATGVGGGSTTGTVIWRSKHPATTSFEAHASQPRATLFDNVVGGFFKGRAGGAIKNLPNHGRHLVLWNYLETDEGESDFKFIATDSPYWRVVPPIIVGFHGAGTTFNEDEIQVLESLGTPVIPESLFEAQLTLRLGKLPEWINNVKKEL